MKQWVKNVCPLSLWTLLLSLIQILYACQPENDVLPDTYEANGFFAYSGSEIALQEITDGLALQDRENHFHEDFLAIYGKPVWEESKVVPVTKEEAMVITPVRPPSGNEVETLWIFFAYRNKVTNVIFTKEMLPYADSGLDWGFDYFTQKLFPDSGFRKYHFSEPDKNILTRTEIYVVYCVDYTVSLEFPDQTVTASGRHCWTEYYSTSNIETIDHVQSPANVRVDAIYTRQQGNWGGGTPQNNWYGNTSEERFNYGCVLAEDANLNEEFKSQLISTVNQFATYPVFEGLYGLASRKTITIRRNPLLKYQAQFNKKDHCIYFKSETSLYLFDMGGELIHAAQAIQYGDKMVDEIRNFEFEAKVIYDIVSTRQYIPGGIKGNIGCDNAFMKNYADFIDRIANRTPMSITASDINTYFALLDQWHNYSGRVDHSIFPMLLITYVISFNH